MLLNKLSNTVNHQINASICVCSNDFYLLVKLCKWWDPRDKINSDGGEKEEIVFFFVRQICAATNETGLTEGLVAIPPFFYQCLADLVPVPSGKRQSRGAILPLQALLALLDNVQGLQPWGNWDYGSGGAAVLLQNHHWQKKPGRSPIPMCACGFCCFLGTSPWPEESSLKPH